MMKVANLPILLITSVFLVACSNTQTTQSVAGIDTPMEIEGISIIFTGAEFYSGPYNMIQPTSSGDILLLVKGEVLSGDAEKLGNWGVIYGEEYPRVVNQVTTFTSADIIEHKFTWYFSVPKGKKDDKLLPIYLPEGQVIDLSSFQTVEP